MPAYSPREVSELEGANWFKHYMARAVAEYQLFQRIELPNDNYDSKLRYMVGMELKQKRRGYYFSMSFLDESCRLCKRCTRPITCDNPLSRPSWKSVPELRDKYDLREGEGLLLIGPPPSNETLKEETVTGEMKQVRETIENVYPINVYSLPTDEVAVTWMTVLQCMYGCRVYSKFSRRWSCVPFCPSPDETRNILSMYNYALVLNKHYSPPLFNVSWLGSNPLRDLDQKIWATRCYGEMNKLTLRVERQLIELGFDVYAYGMSPCHVCVKCSYPNKCKHPSKLRFSADACGIDIYQAAKKAGATFEVPPKNQINLFEIILIK